uniref:Uncharacterized protein n=1 Tax=Nelumbo nucifera TaxID=4432 RepID=A0A822ZTG9_NELNU|nr:TPA_asm: hypothetical protein HUJ06_016592 [Nelumbo nucifera]
MKIGERSPRTIMQLHPPERDQKFRMEDSSPSSSNHVHSSLSLSEKRKNKQCDFVRPALQLQGKNSRRKIRKSGSTYSFPSASMQSYAFRAEQVHPCK